MEMCPQGHEYTDQNVGRNARGHRYCKTCNRIRARGCEDPACMVWGDCRLNFELNHREMFR